MLARLGATGSVLLVLFLSAGALASPSQPAAAALSAWTLTGSGFAAGTFVNTSVVGSALELTPNPLPSNRTMVLDVGPLGSADSASVAYPFVLREGPTSYKMWYTGNSGNHVSILLAESADGLHWTKRGVVMDMSNGAGSPFVLKIGSRYEMWFTVVNWGGSAIGYRDQIYNATSKDGVTWTNATLALDTGTAGGWDADTVSQPWIVRDGAGLYRMYYGGWNDAAQVRIGVATSSDLSHWTRYGGNPVLTWGASSDWDAAGVATPSLLFGTPWVMYYYGRQNATLGQLGRATSTDGYTWSKSAANPVIVSEPSPAWDDSGVSSPDLLNSSFAPGLYFSGSDGTYTRIGLYSFAPPPPPPSVFSGTYLSPIFDSGSLGTGWASLTSVASVPPTTTVALRTRAGNTSLPDGTWTGWVPASSMAWLPRTRYAQAAVDFTSPQANRTPAVASVTLQYALDSGPAAVPTGPSPSLWSNHANPLLRWNQSDPEGDPIVAERVQMSPASNFLLAPVDSGNLAAGTTGWQAPPLADGIWYWRVQAEDGYGVWGTGPTSTYLVDTTPPFVSVVSPTTGALVHARDVEITWIASDALSGLAGVDVAVDSGLPIVYGPGATHAVLAGLADGAHTVRVTAVDQAGNTASLAVAITVNTNPLDVNGPYGATPLGVLFLGIVGAGTLLAALVFRRQSRRPPQPPGT